MLFLLHIRCLRAMHAGVRAATQQRWEDAERFFQIVLQQEPDSASAYSNLGNVHLSEGLPEQAARDFSRAIELAPDVSMPSWVCNITAYSLGGASSSVCLHCQAPVPYLNRALAEEQLGVEADARSERAAAQRHYEAAIQVRSPGADDSQYSAPSTNGISEREDVPWFVIQDCRAAQSRDAKEFAAYFNEGNVQAMLSPCMT